MKNLEKLTGLYQQSLKQGLEGIQAASRCFVDFEPVINEGLAESLFEELKETIIDDYETFLRNGYVFKLKKDVSMSLNL